MSNPYNRLLARYMLSWQIYNFKKGRALAVIYPNYDGYNFMPGVRHGYMPGHRNGKQKLNATTIIDRHDDLAKEKEWDHFWVGENYVESRRVYEKYQENPPDEDFRNQVHSRSPAIGTLLPPDIKDVLREYYEELSVVDHLFKLVAYETDPTDADNAPAPPDDNDVIISTDDDATSTSTDDVTNLTDDPTNPANDAPIPTGNLTSPTNSSTLSSVPETPTSAGSDTPKPAMRTTSPTSSLNATPTPSTSFVPSITDAIPLTTIDATALDADMSSLDDAIPSPTVDIIMPMAINPLPTSTSDGGIMSDIDVALPPAPDAALVADRTTAISVDTIPLPFVKPITPADITAVPHVAAEATESTNCTVNPTLLSSFDTVPFSTFNTIDPTLTNTLPTANTTSRTIQGTPSLASRIVHGPLASSSRELSSVVGSSDITKLNVPPPVEDQDDTSKGGEKDISADFEGRFHDSESDIQGHRAPSMWKNVAENDVNMAEGHGLSNPAHGGSDINMLIDGMF